MLGDWRNRLGLKLTGIICGELALVYLFLTAVGTRTWLTYMLMGMQLLTVLTASGTALYADRYLRRGGAIASRAGSNE